MSCILEGFQLVEDMYHPGYYSATNLCYSDRPQPGLEMSEKNSKIRPTGYSEAGFMVISNLVLFSRPCVKIQIIPAEYGTTPGIVAFSAMVPV
ncbi:hypothetical protein CEXT_236301 [Caerostris extrusa]|uniref:Uncharacterized protein n=1 Tax=Caerostris extrusa TaxID=172846 RepID=A0AAV4V049_CAEEX|nr:hypothetical protein CEXT_236301 [Caerostris extrusa]